MVVLSFFFDFISQNDNSEFSQIAQAFYTLYSAKEYKSNPSNWSIIQDNRGVIYIGNSECVLEFDGSSYRIIELPHSQLVRAFTLDDNEEFDEGNLVKSLSNNNGLSSNEIVHKVIEDVKLFTNGVEQSDDITCLALKYLKN